MRTFQILMVGPTRVGKTSTLASMSDSLRSEVNKLQYHTTIPDDLLQIVTQFRDSVKKNEFVVKQLPMKDGTGKKIVYPIDIISQDQDNDINVEFIDVPGGWFIPPSQEAPNINYDEVKNILKNSVASLWCIDCVSMIEGKNDPEHDYHKSRNEPELIAELYKNMPDLPPKHRIIFVLMRAETYVHEKGRGVDWLIEQFDKYYGAIIADLKKRFNNREIEIYATFVETLGCFKFKSWQKNQETKELEATYCKFADQYTPRNCEAPALLAIDTSLQEAIAFYEREKEKNLDEFCKMRKGFLGRMLGWLYQAATGGDKDQYSRVIDIYNLLVQNKPLVPSEFPKEFEVNPLLNAHITLIRLQRAAGVMKGLIATKKIENLIYVR